MKKVLLGMLLLVSPSFAAATAATDHSMVPGGSELLAGYVASNTATATITGAPAGTLTVTIPVTAGYMRTIMPNLQVGIRGNFTIATAAQSWKGLVWGTWNFDEKINESMFVGVGAGLVGGTISFAAAAEIGKRFEILPHLTWRPALQVDHTFDGGAYWNFNAQLVSFSYIW